MSSFVNNSNDATLYSVLKVFRDNLLNNLNCVKVGYVLEYDYTNRISKVMIYNKDLLGINVDGVQINQDYPVIYAKTLFLGGVNNGVDWDIEKGDECIIFFNDKELESSYISGQVSSLKFSRTHDITDAICLVGFRTLPKTTATDKNLNLHSKNGKIVLDGDAKFNSNIYVGNNQGASGTFTSQDGKAITVENGIITSIA